MWFKKEIHYLDWDVYKKKIAVLDQFAFQQAVRRENIRNL